MLPEAGDLDKPKLAFFFDEAHLLFKDAPKALIEKVEQVTRLIRSKGVSVWYITQNPTDIPDTVLGQIGNRVQHALRAYNPNDQKALRAAARSFRVNPNFDTEETLQALGVGEALVSVLDEKGVPSIVEKAGILPPRSSMSAAPAEVVDQFIDECPLLDKYDAVDDRYSAYEELEEVRAEEQAREEEEARLAELEKERKAMEKAYRQSVSRSTSRRSTSSRSRSTSTRKRTSSSRKSSKSTLEKAVTKTINSTANTVGRELGKQIVRGLLGNFLR